MPDTEWTKCWRCSGELTPERLLLLVDVTPRWILKDALSSRDLVPPTYEIPLCMACAELLKQAEFIATG